jgi:hypothetical protein
MSPILKGSDVGFFLSAIAGDDPRSREARHKQTAVNALTTFLIVECGVMVASHVSLQLVGGGPDNPGVVADDTLRCAHPYLLHTQT